MEHTQGPWRYGETADRRVIDIHEAKAGATRRVICVMDWNAPIDNEDRANAKLIAAAPELLAIVEGILMYPDVKKYIAAKFPGLITQAEAALAGVKGA